MRIIDADALRERLDELYRTSRLVGSSDEYRWGITAATQMVDAAPTLRCDGCRRWIRDRRLQDDGECMDLNRATRPDFACSLWEAK